MQLRELLPSVSVLVQFCFLNPLWPLREIPGFVVHHPGVTMSLIKQRCAQILVRSLVVRIKRYVY